MSKELVSIGGAGTLKISFISEGVISNVELSLLTIQASISVKSLTEDQIIDRINLGGAWSWRQQVPNEIEVQSCRQVYPVTNSGFYQRFLWPFYEMVGSSKVGEKVVIYVAGWN